MDVKVSRWLSEREKILCLRESEKKSEGKEKDKKRESVRVSVLSERLGE